MDVKRYLVFIAPALLILEGGAPCLASGVENAGQVKVQRLGVLTGSSLADVRSETTNGCRIAWVEQRGAKLVVVLDGQPGPECDGISVGSLAFSPDGKRLAYGAKRGEKSVVIVDGQPGPENDDVGSGSLVFSPNSKRFGYFARKGGKWAAVVDNQPGPEYDRIVNGSAPVFSPDGKRLAYAVKKGDRWLVVIDGQPGPECDGVCEDSLVFSPDGKRVAYCVLIGKKYSIVLDGKGGPEYVLVVKGSPVFSPDGKRVGYGAQKGDKQVVVVDDQIGPGYTKVAPPIFSPDGNLVAYSAQDGNEWFVVWDGRPGPKYAVIACGPVFRRDGSLDYIASKGKSIYRVRAGIPFGSNYANYDNLLDALSAREVEPNVAEIEWQFKDLIVAAHAVGGTTAHPFGERPDSAVAVVKSVTPNGCHLAWAGRRQAKMFAVIDGYEKGEYSEIGRNSFVFSPDSKRCAYVAREGDKWFVVAYGKPPYNDPVERSTGFGLPQEGAKYDGIVAGSLVFSSDSKHIAYAAHEGKKSLVVVDEQKDSEWPGIACRPVFLRDGTVEYIAVSAGSFYRVQFRWNNSDTLGAE